MELRNVAHYLWPILARSSSGTGRGGGVGGHPQRWTIRTEEARIQTPMMEVDVVVYALDE